MLVFKKREDKLLVFGLSLREFKCQCDYKECRSTKVSPVFLSAYKRFRIMIGTSCTINSGYRCDRHNFKEKGSALSRHTLGDAVDISLSTLTKFSNEEIETKARLAGFTFVLFYDTFVHLDTRSKNEWTF